MKLSKLPILAFVFTILSSFYFGIYQTNRFEDPKILSYTINPKKTQLNLYWKNDSGEILGSLNHLKTFVESHNQTLLFAMNGGMYKPSLQPQGLFIQNGKTITPLDTNKGNGNFYLEPNGVLYLNHKKESFICQTKAFKNDGNIDFATQSGPMLILNGKIHAQFKMGSTNTNIRNGVGILPNKNLLFAVSKEKINLYDFAQYFKNQGCQNALYLDGFVSRTYLPEKKWIQLDGNFGVIIGATMDK
ncbi:MAG: phosphodiester glycosidase family protein [Bacteroidetes bacterium]|nr:phosphodiester glycosidase family protein [Bacteroidota bacterium]